MDEQAVMRRLDDERKSLFGESAVGEQLPKVTRVHGVHGEWHTIAWSELDAGCSDSVIDEQVAYYQRLGVEVEWTVYAHDAPSDLKQRLSARGFVIGAGEQVLVLDLTNPPKWVLDEPAFRVERITALHQLEDFCSVSEHVHPGGGSVIFSELRAALRTGSRQHVGYVVYAGDVPSSIGRLYTHPDSWFGGLYGGATLEQQRGRGLYRAGLARRARDARALGARYLRVDALPSSQPILERLGFVRLTESWPCVWSLAG